MSHVLLTAGAVLSAALLAILLRTVFVVVETLLRNKVRRRCSWSLAIGASINELYIRFYHRLPRTADDPLPAEGPVLVVGLHRCAVDPFALAALTYRSIRWLMAAEFSDFPVAALFFKSVRVIPVQRGKADLGAIKEALRALHARDVVGIFPEGGIRAGDEDSQARQGAAMLALRTRAVVIPAAIDNLVPSTELFEGMTRRQRNLRVRWGRPVELSDLYGRKAGPAQLAEATRRIMTALRSLHERPEPAPAAGSVAAPAPAAADT
jgi:1-acyl-sn-glycerol-3-phosphate acyltransferase